MTPCFCKSESIDARTAAYWSDDDEEDGQRSPKDRDRKSSLALSPRGKLTKEKSTGDVRDKDKVELSKSRDSKAREDRDSKVIKEKEKKDTK